MNEQSWQMAIDLNLAVLKIAHEVTLTEKRK